MTYDRRAELRDISDQNADRYRSERSEARPVGISERERQMCPDCGKYGIACPECAGVDR
jgi:hypothetical protein